MPVPAAPLPSNIPAHALEIAAAVESCENEAAGIITHPGMPPMQVAAGVTPTQDQMHHYVLNLANNQLKEV